MTLLKRSCAFLTAAMLLFTLGCAATSQRESTGEYVDDSAITTRVKAAIFNEPGLKVLQINVETYKRVVQLSGFVGASADMDKAVELAQGIQGVRSVKNDMRLKSQ
jgi:osmotically-inducible protein OsmY